jgi:hypothetical protein
VIDAVGAVAPTVNIKEFELAVTSKRFSVALAVAKFAPFVVLLEHGIIINEFVEVAAPAKVIVK